MREHPSIPARFMVCGILMVLLATPSTLVVHEVFIEEPVGILSLLLGIGLWAGALTAFFGREKFREVWRIPVYRKIFWWVFGLRAAVSIIFPVGLLIDMVPGFFAGVFAFALSGGPDVEDSSLLIFFLALFQGFLLASIFYGVVAIVYIWVPEHRKDPAKGFCLQCGYDLRASKESCPECGEPIPV